MSLKRKFSFVIMFLLLVGMVSAYDVNDTIRINAEYRESGTLTSSNASIDIYLPNGLQNVDNASMTVDGVGLFHYDYDIPDYEGEYEAIAKFYKSGVYVGNESQTFNVGDVNTLRWNVCPTGTQGWVGMWLLLIILIALGITGMAYRVPMLTGASAIFMMLSSFFTFGCGEILGYASIFFGLIFLFMAASIRT